MKALSIHQPWADLIIRGIKDVENRTWSTAHRGALLIHAGKTLTPGYAVHRFYGPDHEWEQGGIVGIIDVVDVVTNSSSPWAEKADGMFHWILANPRRVSFVPMAGKLNLFEVAWPSPASTTQTHRRDERPFDASAVEQLMTPVVAVEFIAQSLPRERFMDIANALIDDMSADYDEAMADFVDTLGASFITVAEELTLDELNRLLRSLGVAPKRGEHSAIQALMNTIASEDDVADDVVQDDDAVGNGDDDGPEATSESGD